MFFFVLCFGGVVLIKAILLLVFVCAISVISIITYKIIIIIIIITPLIIVLSLLQYILKIIRISSPFKRKYSYFLGILVLTHTHTHCNSGRHIYQSRKLKGTTQWVKKAWVIRGNNCGARREE